MKKSIPVDCCWEEPESQEDKFAKKQKTNLHDGLAAQTPMREEYDRPWHKKVHKDTRHGD